MLNSLVSTGGLSVQLSRQSYIMHLLYDVDRQSFGKAESDPMPANQGSPTPS